MSSFLDVTCPHCGDECEMEFELLGEEYWHDCEHCGAGFAAALEVRVNGEVHADV